MSRADGTSSKIVDDDQSTHSNPDADRRPGQWAKYGLALLFITVFIVAMVRPFYPIVSVLVIGSLLLLFGVLVVLLAIQERLQQE